DTLFVRKRIAVGAEIRLLHAISRSVKALSNNHLPTFLERWLAIKTQINEFQPLTENVESLTVAGVTVFMHCPSPGWPEIGPLNLITPLIKQIVQPGDAFLSERRVSISDTKPFSSNFT